MMRLPAILAVHAVLAAALLLAGCNPVGKEKDPGFVLHLKLQDPDLARVELLNVVIADVADPSREIEKVYSGIVPASGSIPSKTLAVARDPFLVRVLGLRGASSRVLETHIYYEAGRKRVVKLPVVPTPLNRLSRLTPTGGILVPQFHPDTLAYRVVTPEGATKVSLDIVTDYSRALLSVDNGDTIRTGSSVRSFDLGSRPRTVPISVTDLGATNFYTVALMPAPVTQPRLERLEFSPAITLVPAFDPNMNFFEATVPAGVASVEVTPWAASEEMSLRVNGTLHFSGQARSIPLGPEPGATALVTVRVILFDTRMEYSITLTRAQ